MPRNYVQSISCIPFKSCSWVSLCVWFAVSFYYFTETTSRSQVLTTFNLATDTVNG